jgi:hypothetical protein|tara:strand:- start:408 stop:737 length:330 start_codon:yes stop_codon:yes gene_type:complete
MVDRQSAIVPPAPVKKFIPYGQYTEIDQRYYDPVEVVPATEGLGRGRELRPHGDNVKYQPTDLVKQSPSLALDEGSLKVNYETYIYNQVTGWNMHHPRNAPVPQVLRFF